MAKSMVEKYEQILAADPGSMVFIELARALIERGEAARAVAVCDRGLQVHPRSVQGRVTRGRALLLLERTADALEELERATGLDPENPYAFNLVGETLLQRRQYAAALPVLRRAALLREGDAGHAVPRWLDAPAVLAAAAVALTAHVAWEVSEWVARITASDTVWTACAAAVPAIVYLGAVPRFVALPTWPFPARRDAYADGAARIIATVLIAWVIAVNALSPGEPFPLPYVPLANPLDLTLALAVVALTMWVARHARIEARRGIALLGVLVFVSVNGVILRTGHHWLHIPWERGALLASRPLQAALTLAWTATGAALMLLATRRALRTLWMVGAALLAIVLVKLFLVDLGALAGLPRVVAFLGVGAVLLAIGYVSPLPPADDATRGTDPRR
jgi:uncharacterized membrane protein